jgi:antitoxin HicB
MSILADDAVRRYLELPYRVALKRDSADEERPWRATVEELAGCEVRGATPADAAARIPAALADWVATAQAEGREVPEPRDAREYSGKLLLRMPQSLHGELARAAEQDQVSLNAYITGLLSAAIGWRRPYDWSPANEPEAAGLWDDVAVEAPDATERVRRLQRFLAVTLLLNVVVVAVAATIAVILLASAA